jgi:hypothetical protein
MNNYTGPDLPWHRVCIYLVVLSHKNKKKKKTKVNLQRKRKENERVKR